MLGRLREFWRRGIVPKIVIISAGVLGFLLLCCLLLVVVVPRSPRTQQGAAPTTNAPEAAAAVAAPDPTEAPAPTNTAAPAATSEPSTPPGYVSRDLLGDAWPLTVDDGVLACRDQAVVFTSGGTVYAINGTAKQRGDYADIAPIWADHPTIEGLKKDLSPLLERGLALCQ